MSKTLKIVAGVALAFAAPYIGAYAGLLAMSSTVVTVATGLAYGVAGTLLSSAAMPKSVSMQDQGAVLRLQTDSTAPRRVLYGQAATGGTLVFRDTVGAENDDLHMVIALAGHQIESIEGLKFGDQVVPFTGTSSLTITGTYASNLAVTIYDGADGQTADSTLVSASSKWTTNHRLRGVAYAHVKAIWDQEVFPQGLEAILFTLKGRKVYDPRKDSTRGGTGAHRTNDETTWEWSENPVLCMVDYLMGVRIGGKLVAGVGVDPERIDWANIMAEANICDEQVALKAGGSENRYTANGWIDPNRSHRDNLAALGSACGGTMVFQSGKWRCYVAASRTAVKARTGDDVVGAVSLQAKKSTASKVNSVRGVYADPEADYELKDFPPVQVQTYIDSDGGQELWTDLNLPLTKSKTMAQRLSKIALGRARMEKAISGVFSLAALQDQAMDAVSFSHPRFNLNSKKMLVTDWQLTNATTKDGAEALAVQCSLLEEDDLIYSWAAASDEAGVPLPGTVDMPVRLVRPLDSLPGSVAWQTQVSGTGKPTDNADVTSANTSADTAAVNGKSAGGIRTAAENTEKILADDSSVVVHKTSIPPDLTGIGTILTDGLSVSGTITYINTTELQIGDNIITLNADETGAPTQDAGLEIERGLSANVSFYWDEANDQWRADNNLRVDGAINATGGAGSNFYGLGLSRSGSSLISPDIWDQSGYGVAIGANGTTTILKVLPSGVSITGVVNATGDFQSFGGSRHYFYNSADTEWGNIYRDDNYLNLIPGSGASGVYMEGLLNFNNGWRFVGGESASYTGIYNTTYGHWGVFVAANGRTALQYAGNDKLETTSAGAKVTGHFDLQNGYYLRSRNGAGSADVHLISLDSSNVIYIGAGGEATNIAGKLQTTSAGVNVTGNLNVTVGALDFGTFNCTANVTPSLILKNSYSTATQLNLDFYNSVSAVARIHKSASHELLFYAGGGVSTGNNFLIGNASGAAQLMYQGATRLTTSSTGNNLYGTAHVLEGLTYFGPVGGSSKAWISGNTGGAYFSGQARVDNVLTVENSGTAKCTINPYGTYGYCIGIGGIADSTKLWYGTNAAGGNTSYITGAGAAWFDGNITANDVTAESDRRLKIAIEPLSGSLGKVQRLRGVTHEWKPGKGPKGRYNALIAQEVQEVDPSLVREGEDGMLSVNYMKLVPDLIEAIKELSAQNEALAARVAELEGRVG